MVDITTVLPLNFRQHWHIQYEERRGFSPYILVNTRISRDWQYGRIFLDIENLLNESYQEIGGNFRPGRWIRIGGAFSIDLFGAER